MPPAWFVAVSPEASTIGSLCSEPRSRAAANPLPNSTPLTAGTENSRWAMRLSVESKKGSPKAGITPSARHSTMPPTESFAAAVSRRRSSKRAGSVQPPISTICVEKRTRSPSIFLATTPATTSPSVMRPEKWPPPRGSLNPPNLRTAVRSACEGR